MQRSAAQQAVTNRVRDYHWAISEDKGEQDNSPTKVTERKKALCAKRWAAEERVEAKKLAAACGLPFED